MMEHISENETKERGSNFSTDEQRGDGFRTRRCVDKTIWAQHARRPNWASISLLREVEIWTHLEQSQRASSR